jgi:hypothetical protein
MLPIKHIIEPLNKGLEAHPTASSIHIETKAIKE